MTLNSYPKQLLISPIAVIICSILGRSLTNDQENQTYLTEIRISAIRVPFTLYLYTNASNNDNVTPETHLNASSRSQTG